MTLTLIPTTYAGRRARGKMLAAKASCYLGSPRRPGGIAAGRSLVRGDPERWADFARSGGLNPDYLPDKLRATDPLYWQRKLKKAGRRQIEEMWIIAGATEIKWCSPDAAARAVTEQKESDKWAAKTEFVSDDGVVVDGEELLTSTRRDKRRRAELLARAAGLQRLASDSEREVPYLITITLPSQFHPTTSAGGPRRENPHYDEKNTPDVAHKWAQNKWAKVRAELGRKDLMPYWVMAAQPHKDGCPHYHTVTWLSGAAEAVEVETILRDHFCGESEHAVDVRALQGGADGGAKYVARTLSYIGRSTAPDPEGQDEAANVTEWSKIWGIRRYRTSSSKASIWRLLRREDLNVGGPVRAAQAAARAGDFATFLQASASAGLRPAYLPALNRYGEKTQKLIGVKAGGAGVDEVIWVPLRTWQMQRKTPKSPERTVMHIYQDGDSIGACASAPAKNEVVAGRFGLPPPPRGSAGAGKTGRECGAGEGRRANLEQELRAAFAGVT